MLKRVIEPQEEPVTVEDVKAELILTGTSDDDLLIAQYITAARELVENHTKTSLLYQTWELSVPVYELGPVIQLPRPPLVAITSVAYVDDQGTEHTFDSDYYFLDQRHECLRLKVGYTWEVSEVLYYVITYRTGAGLEEIPLEIRQAIVQLAVNMYENREEFRVPKGTLKLLATYKRYQL